MPDIHVPHLDAEHEAAAGRPRRSWQSVVKIGVEVALITVGVFLGLAGEQWRESARHRELARESLQRFRAEIVSNRAEVLRVHARHENELHAMEAYLTANRQALQEHMADPRKPIPLPLPDMVTDSAGLTYSAWDVALATQSLAYLDAGLVGELSATYRLQQIYDEAHRAIQLSSYSMSADVGYLNGVTSYFGDAALYETLLQTRYDAILPRLDTAIGAGR